MSTTEQTPTEKLAVDAETLGNMVLGIGSASRYQVPGVLPAERQALNEDLDPKRIKKKPGSGNDYLAEHDVVRTANRIFGFGRWGTQVKWLELCAAGPMKNGKGEEGFYVSYRCCVTLTVSGCVPVDGVGYGDAFEKQWSAQATSHELAVKEAESDAIKRAFKKFGDQFGLILYAKADDKQRIAAEKAEAEYNAPAAQADIDELLSIAERLGNEQIKSALAAEVREHGDARAGWVARALDKARNLAANGTPEPEADENPAEAAQEPPQPVDSAPAAVQEGSAANPPQEAAQAAGHAAAQRAATGKPLPEGDRAASDDEVAVFMQLAARLGPPGTKKATADVSAQRSLYGGKVSSAWLGVQCEQIGAVLKRAGQQVDAAGEPRGVTAEQEQALTQEFAGAVERDGE